MAKKAAPKQTERQGPASVPPELYRHSDPLVRRLRLLSPTGEAVDLAQEFRDARVVGFLFGEEWNPKSSAPIYNRTHELARVRPHTFKCVFVSLAENEAGHRNAALGKSWLSMDWNDGALASDEAPRETSRGEDFLLPGDDPSSDASDDPAAYARPYSRAWLGQNRTVLGLPTLHIYHIPTRRWLTGVGGVREEVLTKERRKETYETWERGERVGITTRDVILAFRWPIAILLFVIVYFLTSNEDPSAVVLRLGTWFMGDAAKGDPPGDLLQDIGRPDL